MLVTVYVMTMMVFEFHSFMYENYKHMATLFLFRLQKQEEKKVLSAVVILYKLTANAMLPLKRFPPIIYTNRCVQTKSFIFRLKFNTRLVVTRFTLREYINRGKSREMEQTLRRTI